MSTERESPQEALRRTTVGTVRFDDGRPLVGARVHFAFVPVGGEHLAPADAKEAITDDHGRFRTSLRSCTKYRAWAIGAPAGPDDNSARPVSEIVWTTAADLIELQVARILEPRKLQFAGLDRWADWGPFKVRWLIDGIEAPCEPVAVDAEGRFAVPPVPAARCSGELMNAHGGVFETFTFDPRRKRREVRVDPPREIPVRATDAAGNAVEDVEIWERISSPGGEGDLLSVPSIDRPMWRLLGTTDAEGRFVARIASRKDPMKNSGWHQVTFLGRKAGHASCFSGFRREPFSNGKEFDREDLTELPFVMLPARPLRGRLRDTGGTLAGLPLRIAAEARITAKDGNGWIHEKLLWSVETDAEGRFEIAEMPTGIERCFVLPQPHAASNEAFPENLRRSAPPQPLALHPRKLDRDKDNEFDLSTAREVRLQLLDAHSGPAGSARVMFLSQNEGDPSCGWWTPQTVPDRAGRVAMRLEAGRWFVFVRDATSMASATIDLDEDAELTLKLEPMAAMHGTVVDAEGRPIANAVLNCHSSTFHSGDNESPLQPIAQSLNWRWIDSVRTDAEGRFVCAFLDMPNMYYEARFKAAGRQSDEFKIIASKDPETITVK